MALHPSPQQILLLGGVHSGAIPELLKHHPAHLTAVQIDSLYVTNAAPDSFAFLEESLHSHIVHLKNEDPRTFLHKSMDHYYDVVLFNCPEPGSLSTARYYSYNFMRDIRRVLKQDGIFAMPVRSSENLLDKHQRQYLAVILETVSKAFSDGSYRLIPGNTALLLATPDPEPLLLNPEMILEQLHNRRVSSHYVSQGYLPFKLHPYQISQSDDMIKTLKGKTSTDISPHVFTRFLELWHAQFFTIPSLMVSSPSARLPIWFGLGVLIFCLHSIFRRNQRNLLVLGITIVGSIQIIAEMILVFLLQLHSGDAYLKIGLLLGSFTAGLAIGSALTIRLQYRWHSSSMGKQIITGSLLCLDLLIIAGIATGFLPGIEWVLNCAALLLGLFGGMYFAVASHAYPQSAGLLYGFDLLGSSIAAIGMAMVLIHVFSLPEIIVTLIGLMLINILFLGRANKQ